MFIAPDTTCGQGSKATFRGGHCICGTFPVDARLDCGQGSHKDCPYPLTPQLETKN